MIVPASCSLYPTDIRTNLHATSRTWSRTYTIQATDIQISTGTGTLLFTLWIIVSPPPLAIVPGSTPIWVGAIHAPVPGG